MTNLDITYCSRTCEIGKRASKEFLDQNNSAYEAALDFHIFVEKCFNTCKYKEIHTGSSVQRK